MRNILNETIKMNNGLEIPRIGLGTYLMTDPEITKKTIAHALKNGYKMIDTADIYKNHHLVAQAIKEAGIQREDIFITTKVWVTNFGYDNTIKSVEKMLEELNTKYLDLVLLHWPSLKFDKIVESYKALEHLIKQGKIKSIGVSNFMIEHLTILIKNVEIIPAINQVQLHPGLTLLELQQFHNKYNIITESWQTIMKGKVAEIDLISKLAKKYKVDAAAVALRWAYQQNILIIPKSNTPERIITNAKYLESFELTNSEIDEINNIVIDIKNYTDPYTVNFEK